MSEKIDFSTLFKKNSSFFNLIYGKINSLEFLDELINLNIPESLLKINHDLQQIEFGSLSYNRKLDYLFFQHLIKEITLIYENSFTQIKTFKIYKTALKIIFSKFYRQIFLDDNIKRETYRNLEENFSKYLIEISKIDISIYPLDVYTSKNLYLFVNELIDLFYEIEQKLGENLTQNEKKRIADIINLIIEKFKDFNRIILKKSKDMNTKLPVLRPILLEDLLKLNGFELEDNKILQHIFKTKFNIKKELEKFLQSNFPGKSINTVFNNFNDQKVLSLKNKKQIIEDEVSKSQKWLKNNNYFDNTEIFPLNIQHSKVLNLEWMSPIRIETISNKREILGIKVILINDSGMISKKSINRLSRWDIKQWTLTTLIPGKYFITKILTDLNKLNVLGSRGEIGLQRWIFLLSQIYIRRNYFSDIDDKFMSLLYSFYHFSLLLGVNQFFEGKTIEEICFEIHNTTGIELNICTNDFYSYYSNFYEKLLITFEGLFLMQLEKIFRSQSLPMQRFVDVIIKNINYPFIIINQIFEKSFKITSQDINYDDLSDFLNI
jgi:hypothetical protein